MHEAARVTDKTSHGGELSPAGHPKVTVDGLPSCTIGDRHTCPLHPPCNPIVSGSETVSIGGLLAAREIDICQCMQGSVPVPAIIIGPCSSTVIIGGASVAYPLLETQNCYGYASGSSTFRQPGETSGNKADGLGDYNVAAVKKRLIQDLGAPMADPKATAPPGMHKIAFFTFPDVDPSNPPQTSSGGLAWDFHVYRQDSDGYWSHKPGGTPIRRFDSSCQPITDPSTADRSMDLDSDADGAYSEYVGTWLVSD